MRLHSSLFAAASLCTAVAGRHHDVNVGKGGALKFDPENVDAKHDDTITYHFFAKNHAVAQSTFEHPCQYQDGGIFSGFTPNESQDEPAATTFTITVNNTKPLWFYCPQTNGDHCQKGMVHSVNAPKEGNTLDVYKKKAVDAPKSTAREGGLPLGGLRALRVDVGAGGELAFSPNDIQASPGTVVQFSFNPKNHTVTQSSFDKPCKQLEHGFSSGFIPTEVSPSGVLFNLLVNDTKPLWFYCAQTNGDHCQKGMVGSINAPTEGNNFYAFKDRAIQASKPSTIADHAPLGGTLLVNGSLVTSLAGNVLGAQPWGDEYLKYIPPVGAHDAYMVDMAGGGPIEEYGWADNMTSDATRYLQLLNWFDNILLSLLMQGHEKLTTGEWRHEYPKSIVHAVGSMTAQSWMLRTAATDSLQHYGEDVVQVCRYNIDLPSVGVFIDTLVTVTMLEAGLLLDAVARVAETDRWLVPLVAASLGAKARMLAVFNLMQDRVASAAPREPALPARFVHSYASSHFVGSCPAQIEGWDAQPLTELEIEEEILDPNSGRVVAVELEFAEGKREGELWAAFLGPWGVVRFVPLSGDNMADVPGDLWGHVWIVVTKKKDVKVSDLWDVSVAGPALLWIGQP